MSRILTLVSLVFLPFLAQAESSLEIAGQRLAASQLLQDLTGAKGAKSIRGTTALWTDVVVQSPQDSSAFKSLELDLRSTDLEGQLRDANFRIMAPKKRSLAVGLRPTLVLMVLRAPANSLGYDKVFYQVLAMALQDVTPQGGDTLSLCTWAKMGDPISSSGDDHKDIDAIRASARSVVKAFISVAQDKEGDVKK